MLDSILIVFLVCFIVPILFHWKQVANMGKYRIFRHTEIAQKMISNIPHKDFLELNKFEFYDPFIYKNIELGVWMQNSSSTMQRNYTLIMSSISDNVKTIDRNAGLKVFEFVTLFSNNVSLTTTTSPSAFVFPQPPGYFLQSKKTDSIEDLYQYHLEGEDFLLNEHGVEVAPITNNIEHLLNQEIQIRGKYIRKIPLFWLKAPYWIFIYRFRMQGISVRDQKCRVGNAHEKPHAEQ